MRLQYEQVSHIDLKSSFNENLIHKFEFVEKLKSCSSNEQFVSFFKYNVRKHVRLETLLVINKLLL